MAELPPVEASATTNQVIKRHGEETTHSYDWRHNSQSECGKGNLSKLWVFILNKNSVQGDTSS
jgi:hypothetical protein